MNDDSQNDVRNDGQKAPKPEATIRPGRAGGEAPADKDQTADSAGEYRHGDLWDGDYVPDPETLKRVLRDFVKEHLTQASRIQPLPLQWLWERRLPVGQLTLLAGDPGTGKSLVALDLAARVSTGALWPDERGPDEPGPDVPAQMPPASPHAAVNGHPPGCRSREPANVLILAAHE